MLTKDLVRFKNKEKTITPILIDPEDASLLEMGKKLIDMFKSAEGKTRTELLEESKLIIEGTSCSVVVVRGFEKLLLDRTEFNTAPNDELIQFRQEMFTQTSQWLSSEHFLNYSQYQQQIQEVFKRPLPELATSLYSDLPAYQEVVKFKAISPERLLQRYNCAQVQGLLIHCNQLELTVSGSQPVLLRQLFKYLRFCQLLASIHKEGKNSYQITVDGPLNLFYQTQKYGLNLALFFPAILHQEKWKLEAQIQLKNQQQYQLTLDQSCGIQPYSYQYLAYIPEEILLFQQTFHQKAAGWELLPGNDFVPLEGELYCFPDYKLLYESGQEVFMELFHPWHATHLSDRLQNLENQKNPVLILGVSNVLLKEPLVAEMIEKSLYFSQYGFMFRKMPTMDKLLPVLGRVLTDG